MRWPRPMMRRPAASSASSQARMELTAPSASSMSRTGPGAPPCSGPLRAPIAATIALTVSEPEAGALISDLPVRPAGHTSIEPPDGLRYSRPVLVLWLEYSWASHGLSELKASRPVQVTVTSAPDSKRKDDCYCADGNDAGGR